MGAKRPFVALAAVKPRVMCGEKMWLASKCEPSPPDLMNRSCMHTTPLMCLQEITLMAGTLLHTLASNAFDG